MFIAASRFGHAFRRSARPCTTIIESKIKRSAKTHLCGVIVDGVKYKIYQVTHEKPGEIEDPVTSQTQAFAALLFPILLFTQMMPDTIIIKASIKAMSAIIILSLRYCGKR